jgi:hypothetical protein
METIRVDIAYRPLRICWAIRGDDKQSFRRVVRYSHALWGGRFNPIAVVDRVEEAKRLVEVFRADMIVPVGDSDEAKAFAASFPHLPTPFFSGDIFLKEDDRNGHCQVLDIQNALVHLRHRPEWKSVIQLGMRSYVWQQDEPLADVLLMQLGAYPSVEEVGTDYRSMFKDACEATEHEIGREQELPADIFEHPGIAYLARYGLEPHYSSRNGRDHPGFFVGDASNLKDLVTFWNLRAADTMLLFVDTGHLNRYKALIPAWQRCVDEELSYRRHGFVDHVAIWHRRVEGTGIDAQELTMPFGPGPHTVCGVDEVSWNGLNIYPPMMHLGQSSSLGVLVDDSEQPKLTFALSDRPFATDIWFHTQHLAASLSFMGGLYSNSDYTLNPPYIPEFNEFVSRAMHFHPDRVRLEPERLAIVISAMETDTYLYALSVFDILKQSFASAGYVAKLSSGGLIARQLISQLGGLFGAYVFKIPGVRRLLRTYGPTESFSKKSAAQLIGQRDPERPDVSFRDFERMHVEPRASDEKLQPSHVFGYLVEKGLFRIGSELSCPHCQMTSWTALDSLRQRLPCQMCGREFEATRQLVESDWAYRRSGVLGAERNAQGAVPVVLTLQQLFANFSTFFDSSAYVTSLDLIPKPGTCLPTCEVDFVWIVRQPFPKKTVIVLAECKDQGNKANHGKGDGGTIDAKDIENMRAVADAFPRDRFEVFVLLAKLCAFTAQEVELAKSLNTSYQRRVILLTDRELSSFHLYERARKQFSMRSHGRDIASMAEATVEIFFEPKPAGPDAVT